MNQQAHALLCCESSSLHTTAPIQSMSFDYQWPSRQTLILPLISHSHAGAEQKANRCEEMGMHSLFKLCAYVIQKILSLFPSGPKNVMHWLIIAGTTWCMQYASCVLEHPLP